MRVELRETQLKVEHIAFESLFVRLDLDDPGEEVFVLVEEDLDAMEWIGEGLDEVFLDSRQTIDGH